MSFTYLRKIILWGGVFLIPLSCTNNSVDKPDFEFSRDENIMKIIPPKPVRIKVKRSVKGQYSWELTGKSMEEIIMINKTLERELTGNDGVEEE